MEETVGGSSRFLACGRWWSCLWKSYWPLKSSSPSPPRPTSPSSSPLPPLTTTTASTRRRRHHHCQGGTWTWTWASPSPTSQQTHGLQPDHCHGVPRRRPPSYRRAHAIRAARWRADRCVVHPRECDVATNGHRRHVIWGSYLCQDWVEGQNYVHGRHATKK